MTKSKQQIIDDITAHIQKRGGAYGDWYVGISSHARDRLFSAHKVHEKGDRWIHRRAPSQEAAREIENYFLSNLAADGHTAEGENSASTVYAYRKAPHTMP